MLVLLALERFLEAVASTPFPQVGKGTVSLGATQGAKETFIATLLDHADQTLYHSKGNGRNQITFFEDMLNQGLTKPEDITLGGIEFFGSGLPGEGQAVGVVDEAFRGEHERIDGIECVAEFQLDPLLPQHLVRAAELTVEGICPGWNPVAQMDLVCGSTLALNREGLAGFHLHAEVADATPVVLGVVPKGWPHARLLAAVDRRLVAPQILCVLGGIKGKAFLLDGRKGLRKIRRHPSIQGKDERWRHLGIGFLGRFLGHQARRHQGCKEEAMGWAHLGLRLWSRMP